MTLLDKQNRTLQTLRAKVNFTQERKVASIPMNVLTNGRITGNQTDHPGKILGIVDIQRKPRARLQNFRQTWLDLGAGLKVVQILKEGYILPFRTLPNLARSPTIISCYVNPQQEPLPVGGITSAYGQKRSRPYAKSEISRVFQPSIFGPQTQQVETYTRSEQFKPIPQGSKIQNGDTGNHQNLPPARGVGYLNRLLPHSNTGIIQEISEISRPGSDIPVQGTAIQFVYSTHGVHIVAKEVKLMAIHKGIRIHQYQDDWLVRARSHQISLQHTQDLAKMCQ